jgi:4-amino-4-deoxy-L-arabinose transferase-like glycosyltransferase
MERLRRSWQTWRALTFTALVVVALYALGIGNHTLWGYHEPYVGGIIRDMVSNRDFVVPTLNGQPYLEKPPLYYAFGAMVCRTFGTFQPWALRLPSALLAMGTCAWISFVAWRTSSTRAAHLAGFTLATSYLFLEVGQSALVDMALTAAVSFALGLAFLAILEPHHRSRWMPWFWLALGCSFMAKGVVGPFMIGLPLAATFLLQRDRALVRGFLAWNWGLAAALLMVATWVTLLAWRGGTSFLDEVFLRNTIGRFTQNPGLVPMTGRLGEHVEAWYFYPWRLPVNVLPWFALWAAALCAALPRRGQSRTPRTYFLPLAFALNLILLSCSEAKREVYLLPVLPLTFLHMALWLDGRLPRIRQRLDRPLRWILGFTLGLITLVGAGFPWVLVREAGLSRFLAMAIGLLMGVLGARVARQMRQCDYPRALLAASAQWTLFLATLLVFGVPAMDRCDWKPLQAPYREAMVVHEAGARILCAGLTETQMGFASLTFQQQLPDLQDPSQLQGALDQPGPVAVLVEPAFWARAQAQGVHGTVLTTEADGLPPRRRLKAPFLVVNQAGRGIPLQEQAARAIIGTRAEGPSPVRVVPG